MNRIRFELKNVVEIVPHICGSEREAEMIAANRVIAYNHSKNEPLGEKANNRLRYVKNLLPDYVLFLGSDDFITKELILFYVDMIRKGFEEIAPMDIYYIAGKQAAYSPGYVNSRKGESLAVGRLLSTRVLKLVKWTLWAQLTKVGLDSNARNRLDQVGHKKFTYKLRDKNLFIVDVKGKDSLTKFVMRDHFEPYDIKELLIKIPILNGII